VSGEFPITNGYGHGELSSSLHKRIHPYPVSEPGSFLFMIKFATLLLIIMLV
jgi:hypothetical protein